MIETGLQVYQDKCKNCLFSKDRLTTADRMKEMTDSCVQDDKHFICHVSTLDNDGNIMCRGFFDAFGQKIQIVQVAQRLNMLEFVDQPEADRKLSHADIMKLPR